MNLTFLKPAEQELDEAYHYYNEQRKNLGDELIQEVTHSLARLSEFPLAYPLISSRARRCLVARFPYALIYQYLEDQCSVRILAFAHQHRKPDYWVTRVLD